MTGPGRIAALAVANAGRHACARNSLGGRGFGSSCTGNGGLPEYWCADFAKWVWQHSGVADLAELSPAAGSFYLYGLRNKTLTATPAVGDAAVYNYYGGGVAEHVAIVTAVNPDGTVVTASGDWGGEGGSEAHFASTSRVSLNAPAYQATVGKVPAEMGMTLSAFVQPVGVRVSPVVGATTEPVGTAITPSQPITSPNGMYSLGVDPTTGGLAEELGSQVVWSPGTVGEPGDEAVLEPSGALVLEDVSGDVFWSSAGTEPTTSTEPDATVSLNNDGELAVENGTTVSWSESPTPGLLGSGLSLLPGEKLVSPDALYQLDMQKDGNLVEYSGGLPLWWTKTAHHPGASATVTTTGKLEILSAQGAVLWSSRGEGVPGSQLELLENGVLELESNASLSWSNGY